MKILFTLCARGGSKGLKNKNIKPLLGYPLIHYSIKFVESFRKQYPDYRVDCIISSDSPEIISISSNYSDLITIKRDDQLSQDETPKIPVIIDATLHAEKEKKIGYDYVIDLDVTSPLRKTNNIISSLKKLEESDFDVIFSAVESRRNPYFNMVEIQKGIAKRIIETNFVYRQQAPEVYDLNASIYTFRRKSLGTKIKYSAFDGKAFIELMNDTYVLDIDKPQDFTIFEILVENYYVNVYPELFKEGRE